jgi:hypothetical protein
MRASIPRAERARATAAPAGSPRACSGRRGREGAKRGGELLDLADHQGGDRGRRGCERPRRPSAGRAVAGAARGSAHAARARRRLQQARRSGVVGRRDRARHGIQRRAADDAWRKYARRNGARRQRRCCGTADQPSPRTSRGSRRPRRPARSSSRARRVLDVGIELEARGERRCRRGPRPGTRTLGMNTAAGATHETRAIGVARKTTSPRRGANPTRMAGSAGPAV